MLIRCGSMQHLIAVSETNFCIPLSAHWRAETFCFLSAYLHHRTLSTGCQKHSRLLVYYRNTEVLIPLPLCTYHRGNEDRQVAQLLSPRKAKITAKDRGNVCSEFFPNHYRHDRKPKKCQVTEDSMTTFRTKKKPKKRKVEIGHCHLMWLGFYFSLHLLRGGGAGLLETRGCGTRSSARICKLYLHINMLDNFTPRQVSNIMQTSNESGNSLHWIGIYEYFKN